MEIVVICLKYLTVSTRFLASQGQESYLVYILSVVSNVVHVVSHREHLINAD